MGSREKAPALDSPSVEIHVADGAPHALVRCHTLTTGLRLSRIIE
jgi:hypothetical protein